MRGARKLVPQPCHHDNASDFPPALAHCVKAFGMTLTRTGDASRHRIFLSTSPPDWGNPRRFVPAPLSIRGAPVESSSTL